MSQATLIIAPQWIGDAVMTQPLLAALHAQGAQLTVAALPWVAPVYAAMPQVARTLELPFAHGKLDWRKRRALARSLRGQFQAAYVLPNSLKSALIPWLAGIPQRIGYRGEARSLLLTRSLPNPDKQQRPPMVQWYAALAREAAGTHLPPDARPQLHISPAVRDAALAAFGLSAHTYGVLVPGAEFGDAKRWPTQHFIALAQSRKEPIILLGSGKDAALCEAIAQAAGGHVRSLAGKTQLREAIALISAARWQVGNDSGLMHVAAAFDTPQVALFGSSSPEHTPPLSPQARVIWLKHDASYQPPLDCAPCFARVCPLEHKRCLQDIHPARVEAALEEIGLCGNPLAQRSL